MALHALLSILKVPKVLLSRLQTVVNDILECQVQSNATDDVLKTVQSDENEYTHIHNDAAKQAENYRLDSVAPSLARRQKHRQRYPTSESNRYYFQAVAAPLLDFMLDQSDERFAGHHEIATSLCALVSHCFRKTTFEDLKPALLFYEKFLAANILDSVDDCGHCGKRSGKIIRLFFLILYIDSSKLFRKIFFN